MVARFIVGTTRIFAQATTGIAKTSTRLQQASPFHSNFSSLAPRISVGKVTIKEMGPRDGLQNEKKFIPTKEKISFIDSLIDAGICYTEASGFISPKWVPQLADHRAVTAAAQKIADQHPLHPIISVLVPNLKGFEAAVETKVKEFADLPLLQKLFLGKILIAIF